MVLSAILVILTVLLGPLGAGANQVIVTTGQLSLRQVMGSERGIDVITRSTRLLVIKKVNNWYHVVTPTGNVGWIYTEFVQLDKNSVADFVNNTTGIADIYILSKKQIELPGTVIDYSWSDNDELLYIGYLSESEDQFIFKQVDMRENSSKTQELFRAPLWDIAFSGSRYQEKRVLGVAVNRNKRLVAYGGERISLLKLGGEYQRLSDRQIFMSFYPERCGMPVFSPDGKKILFIDYFKDELDGVKKYLRIINDRGHLTNTIYEGDIDWEYYPDWGRDGDKIVFGDGQKIFMIDDNLNASFVTKGKNPQWSPSSDRILYESVGNSEVYVINADGSEKRLIKKPATDPAWDPTGQKVVYVSRGIEISDTEGRERKIISRYGSWPRWSQVGDKVVFKASKNTVEIIDLAKQSPFEYVYTFNLGRDDGIRQGMLLDVYKVKRGLRGQLIGYDQDHWRGKLYITAVQNDYSVAVNLTGKGVSIFDNENMVVHPEGRKYGRLTSSIIRQ